MHHALSKIINCNFYPFCNFFSIYVFFIIPCTYFHSYRNICIIHNFTNDFFNQIRVSQKFTSITIFYYLRCWASHIYVDYIAPFLNFFRYFSHYFKNCTGTGLSEYVQEQRRNEACRLLTTTDTPIQEIGRQIGMPNVSSFIRSFRQQTGLTPGQYRARNGKAAGV